MFDIPSKILLAEDNESLGMLLQDFLELEGYEVTRANDGQEAVHLFRTNPFDLVVLDVMMPQKDGLTTAREIRGENKEIPIVFLTAKNMKEDMYKGFEAGGDDYITKPFDETELAFRIEALLKRAKPAGDQPVEFPIGDFMFDYTTQKLSINGEERRLTARENEILRLLAVQKNQILKREDALVAIWGENDYFHGRSFDVFITKLRKYLRPDPKVKIENVHGVGFILKDKED